MYAFLSCLLFCCLLLPNAFARRTLLDKILGVFNDRVITLSQIKRVRQTLSARSNISPQIYKKSKYSKKELVELNIKQFLVREELANSGYIINDNQVEGQIKETEKRIGTTRKELLQFLKRNNITFEEYFEITRATIEYNIFTSKVIAPLVSVTDQEIKNAFYKKNIKNKALDMKYTLVDFSINRNAVNKKMRSRFRSVIKKFQTTGVLPEEFSKMQTNILGNITEGGLTKKLKKSFEKNSRRRRHPSHPYWKPIPRLLGEKEGCRGI